MNENKIALKFVIFLYGGYMKFVSKVFKLICEFIR